MKLTLIVFLLLSLVMGCESDSDDDAADDDSGGDADTDTDTDSDSDGDSDGDLFSFFYTSMSAMKDRCGQDGCGGNLGGLQGADEICRTIALSVSSSTKTWRAFLSVTDGGDGKPVNAIDRIGTGPWYDINGRLIAQDIAGLQHERPDGNAQAVNDLPDETGQGTKSTGDFHDSLTGSDTEGKLYSTDPASTCQDWTSVDPTPPPQGVDIIAGHSWAASSGPHWINAHPVPDCSPSISDGQSEEGTGVGALGGYGGIYCFAF